MLVYNASDSLCKELCILFPPGIRVTKLLLTFVSLELFGLYAFITSCNWMRNAHTPFTAKIGVVFDRGLDLSSTVFALLWLPRL